MYYTISVVVKADDKREADKIAEGIADSEQALIIECDEAPEHLTRYADEFFGAAS